MENLQVGAYGWNHNDWHKTFYPDDLPEDWRLDFYANTYRVTLVPEQEWHGWDEHQLDEIEEAVEGAFYFYFEVSLSSLQTAADSKQETLKKLTTITQQLADKVGGVVIYDDIDKEKNKGSLESIEHDLAGLNVTLVSNSQKLAGWQWQCADWCCSGEPCGVVGALTSNAKQQTALLKDFEQSLPDDKKSSALLVRDNNVDMTQLNNLKIIAELLGY